LRGGLLGHRDGLWHSDARQIALKHRDAVLEPRDRAAQAGGFDQRNDGEDRKDQHHRNNDCN
jgi:hypothetical protein